MLDISNMSDIECLLSNGVLFQGSVPHFFRSRFTLKDSQPPTRAYVHQGGILDAFGHATLCVDEHAREHLLYMLGRISPAVKPDYILATLWGNNYHKMIDFFCFSNVANWPGNPDVEAFVTENGIVVPKRAALTCGDTLIMLGVEEKYRRGTDNFRSYISTPPPF